MSDDKRQIPILSLFTLMVSAVVILAPAASSAIFFLEILGQYRLQVSFIAFLLALFFLVRGRYVICAAQMGLVLFSVFLVGSAYNMTQGQCAVVDRTLRVFTYNTYHLNNNYQSILNAVDSSNADIVLFQEFKSGFYNSNHAIMKQKYPFHYAELEQGIPQGKALYSKYPINNAKSVLLRGDFQKVIHAKIDVEGHHVSVIGVHTVSPQSQARTRIRNTEIIALQRLVHNLYQGDEPLIVAGDFNSTPWQRNMKDFKQQTGLNNNQLYNIIPTWPVWLPAIARVPIDHIFHSDKFGKYKYYKGLDAGSDHFPVFVDLELCK